jgi:hypothetical protein
VAALTAGIDRRVYIVPHSRAWHLASHSLTFCRFVRWLSRA